MLRAICLAATLGGGPAFAQETPPCRLALLLALDVSSSVDAREHALQQDGVAAALDDAVIRNAILRGGPGTVALAAYEWSGRRQSQTILDWTVLDSDAAIDAVISRLRAAPRSQTRFPTAMGYALGYGATLLGRAPPCDRQVIDLSGDGINNDGFGPQDAYRHFPFAGVTVNGLAVLGADPQVQDYFDDTVRHGPGAFVETTQGYDGYRRAMTRKLLREIGDMMIGTHPAPRTGPRG